MADPKILNEQGILLFNLDRLISTEGVSRSDKGIAKTVPPTPNLAGFSESVNGFYPNVCLFDSKSPGEFLSYLKNRSTDKKVISDTLMRMSTFELSSLVPTIRLFKIYHNPATGKEYQIELPFETKADGIESIFLNSTGRGVGAGIVSVEWKHAPKFEASAPIYDLILRLHLQNVEEFFKTKNAITLEDGKSIGRVSIQDLLYQSKEVRMQTGEGTSTYNPEYYKIKLIVGWAISENGLQSIRMNSNRTDIDAFINALKEQTDIMYLTFVNHDIQFNEDGSIDLQINYHGSAEVEAMDLSKSNILYPGKDYEKEIGDAQKKVDEAKTKSEENYSAQAAAGKSTGPGFFERASNSIVETYDSVMGNKRVEADSRDSSVLDQEKKLENLKKGAKRRKYTYMLKRMLQKKQVHLFIYDPEEIKVFSELVSNLNFKDGASKRTIENYNQAAQNVKDTLGVGSKGSSSATGEVSASEAQRAMTDNSSLDNAGEVQSQKEGVANEEQGKKEDEIIKRIVDGNFSSDITMPSGKKHFAFFYLSSLVDVLLEGLYDNDKNNPSFITKNLRVILGPMTITDYGTLTHDGQTRFQPPSVSDKKGKIIKIYKGKKRTINIGDIPISLKEFTVWFKANIMDKNLEEISFNEFMSSMMQDLVVKCLTDDVYSFAPPQKINVVFDMFSAMTSQHNEGMFLANIQNYRWSPYGVGISPYAGGFRIDATKMKSLRTDFSDFTKDTKPRNYIFVYSAAEGPTNAEGDFDEDSKKGIYHFYYGENRGIIRSIKFSRTDNPYVRADAVLNSNGNRTNNIVREKYNVNLEIFGNTDIQGGTYIYVSPSFQGSSRLANTERLFKDMGIGGYYFVTEVHNFIESGEFVTKIKGVWQTSGDINQTGNIRENGNSNGADMTEADVINEIEP
jgi:KaiC/GvpD/RAD55 family RecA-like ATPase